MKRHADIRFADDRLQTSDWGREGGVCQTRTNANKGEGGVKNSTFVRTSFMDGLLKNYTGFQSKE